MVTHIVFWALKDEAEGHTKKENAEHIKEMLEALVGVIPGLVEAKVGINENGGKYDAALFSKFESWDALRAYDSPPGAPQGESFRQGGSPRTRERGL